MSHSFRVPAFCQGTGCQKKTSALFTAFNLNDWHTRGGRGGKRGYSLRLFAYTGRFRLGLLSSIFSLFWEILNTDWEQCFPDIVCICQLSRFFHIDLGRLDGPGFSQRLKIFPTFPTGLRFPQSCVAADFALRGLCLVWSSWSKKVVASRTRAKG